MMARTNRFYAEHWLRESESKIEAVLARVELRNPPFPIKLHANGDALIVEVYVPHRDTGERTVVCHPFRWPDDRAYRHQPIEQFILQCLRIVFEHELRESLHFDGVRFANPHKGET